MPSIGTKRNEMYLISASTAVSGIIFFFISGLPAINATLPAVQDLVPTPSISSTPFTQSLANILPIDGAALCTAFNQITSDRFGFMVYYLVKVKCKPESNNNRLFEIDCIGLVKYLDSNRRSVPAPIQIAQHECPPKYVCQMIELPSSSGENKREEAACVEEEDVVVETLTTPEDNAQYGNENIHCGLELSLPGPHFQAAAGVKTLELVLTEQVYFSDGKPYPAPLLLIRDKGSQYGLDRALRMNAHVASSSITLEAYRGRFQTREFEFCMKTLPGRLAVPVIFAYSFFQVPHRHHIASIGPS